MVRRNFSQTKNDMKIVFLLRFLAALSYLAFTPCSAEPLTISFLSKESTNKEAVNEWMWALRGSGSKFDTIRSLKSTPGAEHAQLMIIDNAHLDDEEFDFLEKWVSSGGLAIFSAGPDSFGSPDHPSLIHQSQRKAAKAVLGVEIEGYDPGLTFYYPRIIKDSPLVSPLRENDGIRLGNFGLGNRLRFIAVDNRELIGESSRIRPSLGTMIINSHPATMVAHRLGQGMVFFVGFSLGDVASCYPKYLKTIKTMDCSGASSAHGLMKWISANMLWEEHNIQIPLLSESPGDRLHTLVITGDVHDRKAEREDMASVRMAEIAQRTRTPLSLYVEGNLALTAPNFIEKLKEFDNIELSPHNLNGKVFLCRDYVFGRYEILYSISRSQKLLGIPALSRDRSHYLSIRNHGWISDYGTWLTLIKLGYGLVFDYIADSQSHDTPWRINPSWLSGRIESRIIVPQFEHSITTALSDFRLSENEYLHISGISSAQAEIPSQLASFDMYADYVMKWHRLFSRLSTMGGISEIWLWHPEGVMENNGYESIEKILSIFKAEQVEGMINVVRGDILATWRANRDRVNIRAYRSANGQLTTIELEESRLKLLPLPNNSPAFASTITFWVLGNASLPGWKSRTILDPYGRPSTVLTHNIGGMSNPSEKTHE